MSDELDTAERAGAFGRYRVLGVLGEGAMGTVYLAEDPVIGRKVAVKVLQAERGISDNEREEAQSRFEREFKAAGSLTHPHLVTIHDVGREAGTSFIAMEYVEGESLRTVLNRDGKLAPGRAVQLLRQIASALDFAHGRGIIHRDVKPANILLTESGDAKVTDFGVAKVSSVELTRTGIILGTPAYMSPEQVTDQNLSPSSDQFSLAVMAYQMLAGKRPFGGENATKTLYQIAYHEPAMASQVNRSLSPGCDRVLKKALAKKAADRFPNCRSFIEALASSIGVGGAAADGTASPHSDLATRRIQQVSPSISDFSAFEMNPPTLEMAEPQPALTDSLTDDEEEGDFAGPPPAIPAASLPPSASSLEPPILEPLRPTPLAGEKPKTQRSDEEIPGLKSAESSEELSGFPVFGTEDRLELLPIAEEVGTTVDQVYGKVAKDRHYWVWQAVGLGIAIVVACVLWILWSPSF